ncbi:MAG: hypothetical protein F6K56_29390 [Moorea sp. SIO3G5]|nr:hypothetical protein [Moorena sp. SIO3G5]
MINLYSWYRITLFILTTYGLIQLIITLLKYKPYYEKVPGFMKKYFLERGSLVLGKKLNESRHDLIINGLLLLVLVMLNIILWIF